MKMFNKNRKAFTLVELLVVIVVIGILFVVLVSKVDFAADDAKSAGAMTDLRSYQIAAQAIALRDNGFDSAIADLVTDLNEKLDAELALTATGVSSVTDPWGKTYKVIVSDNTVTVYSFGKNMVDNNASGDDVWCKIQYVAASAATGKADVKVTTSED